MTPLVVFPDVRSLLIGHLAGELLAEFDVTVPVVPRVPNPRPSTFVVVRRTGGPRLNLVADDPQVTLDSWAPAEEDADDLAQQCRAIMHAARGAVIDGVPVYRIDEAAGPSQLVDPDTALPFVRQTFSVAVRGAPPVAS